MKKVSNLKNTVKIYDIVFAVITIIVGCLFVWQVLDLYFSRRGLTEIFTRQIVSERLKLLTVPVIIWAVTAVGGFVLHCFTVETKTNVKIDGVYILNNLKKRMPSGEKQGLEVEYAFVKKEERKIKYIKLACALYIAAVVIYGIVYFLIPNNFTELGNATKEIIRMVKYVFPFVVIGFILCSIAAVYESVSAKKQLVAVKKLIVNEKNKNEVVKSNEKILLVVRITLLVVGVGLIVTGIFNGSMHDVFVKAINICTECIGLG